MTVKENVITIYDQFKSYADNHTLREVAENLRYEPWDIVRLSDTMLVAKKVIDKVEYRVRVTKSVLTVAVSVTTWEMGEIK
jgi:hypothetical protein